MTTSLAVGIPTITAVATLDLCVTALHGQAGVVPDIVLIRNGARVEPICAAWEARGVEVHRPESNLGVAASWNFACRRAWARGRDAVLLLNDDVVFTDPHALERFATTTAAEPSAIVVGDALGFAAACLTRTVCDEIGEFDEGFWPAYYEDCDFARRASLCGIPTRIVHVAAEHAGGRTRADDAGIQELFERTFGRNRDRYLAKWGGPPGEETFTSPWDGGEPAPPVRELADG